MRVLGTSLSASREKHAPSLRPTRRCSRPLRARDQWHFGRQCQRSRRLSGNPFGGNPSSPVQNAITREHHKLVMITIQVAGDLDDPFIKTRTTTYGAL